MNRFAPLHLFLFGVFCCAGPLGLLVAYLVARKKENRE
jgi:hypothetical protein